MKACITGCINRCHVCYERVCVIRVCVYVCVSVLLGEGGDVCVTFITHECMLHRMH